MSDPYASTNGGSNHDSWNQPGYGSGQNQGQYPGQHPGYNQGNYPPFTGYQYPVWNLPPRTHGITTAALVLGIIAAVISLVPFFGFIAFVLGPLAMIFGIIGIVRRLNRRGFAVAGLVTGAFGVLVSILYALLFSTMMQYMDKTDTYEFVTRSVGEYHLAITTTDSIPEISNNQRGTYTERLTASSFFGGVVATNVGDNDGNVGCKIFSSDGTLLAEDAATGLGAEAVCMIGAPWMGSNYDFDVSDVLDARMLSGVPAN
ncbi:hypothetical protein CQ018_12870 [Arthrobacter sp. MYb227]|uniref:DUF4190 domain-containing protein n=1 Tax=Arthrobacter sp. MYb227 TaxID=1848601 RepID=UPI000CFC31F3|nr:DUF4190 domain-containing protein [Arthrobacter sp. MYb227]PQZ91538.1 hypothetical protein CQ018_12870 [Arthrobacter sp. MYb227]